VNICSKSVIFVALCSLAAGCSPATEPTFSARNVQVELDLHSLVRLQSNELLGMMQDLEAARKANFRSPRKLERALTDGIAQMDQIHMNLPSLLAAQDVEIADLRQDVKKGLASKAILNTRSDEIERFRRALLGSLKASAARTDITLNALSDPQHQTLSDQRQQTIGLARDLSDARSMIELQL